MVKVSDVMKTDVVSADPEATVRVLTQIMNNNQLGSVVIKDLEKEEPMGIVTWSTIITFIANKGNPDQAKAKNLMKKKLITIEEDKPILEASRAFVKHDIDRMPVVNNKGKLVGILSYKDILATTPEMINIMSEKMKATRMRPPAFNEVITGMCEDCGNYSAKLKNIGSRWTCGECFDQV